MNKEQIIKLLRELEHGWNDDYMLYVWSGMLCLMLKTEHAKLMQDGNYKPLYVSFVGISCDGGDN